MSYSQARLALLSLTVASAAISATTCLADEILTNEPSRADLFARLVKPPGVQAALPQTFAFPSDTRDDAIFGIDVSHYTQDGCKCQLDWSAVPVEKVGFVYLKASQGTAFVDATFAPNWTLLQSMPNIHRGAYHFLSGDADPTAQAQHFLTKLGKPLPGDMPPCVDLEWDFRTVNGQQHDTWSDLTPDQIIDRLQTWLDVVEKATGRRPLIYTSAVWWSDRIKDATKFAKFQNYPIWIADYSAGGRGQEIPSVPDKQPWTIWQFTETGSVTNKSVPGRLDVSIFKGTQAQFSQSFGLSPAPTQAMTTPPATTPPPATPPATTAPPATTTPSTTTATPATTTAATPASPSAPVTTIPPVTATPPIPATTPVTTAPATTTPSTSASPPVAATAPPAPTTPTATQPSAPPAAATPPVTKSP
jgi:lysozyme